VRGWVSTHHAREGLIGWCTRRKNRGCLIWDDAFQTLISLNVSYAIVIECQFTLEWPPDQASLRIARSLICT
jgi:hypothetical protein